MHLAKGLGTPVMLAPGHKGMLLTTEVERGREYIAAGDAFQIVLSQRFQAPFALPPFAFQLRRTWSMRSAWSFGASESRRICFSSGTSYNC